MANLYEEALGIVEQIKDVKLQIVDLNEELAKLDYAFNVAVAQVERSLIKRRGSEKDLAPTAGDRERIFILARNADENIVALQNQRDKLRFEIDRLRVELSYLWEALNLKKIVIQNSQTNEEL